MSLFKSREWWSVNLNESEKYDSQCLLVSIVGRDRYHSILLGNHDGLFRFYSPTSEMTEEGAVTGYKPSDLLLEVQLQFPILQLGMGALVSGSHDKFLAVLHPRLLSVYSFGKKDNVNDVGDQIIMELAYQHQLRHSAHSFVLGPFGGGRGRDFLCLQSLDGLLSFYEQESLVFHVYLPDFLLPAPFKYLDKIDCFLFLNASLTLDCYSYESLASAGSSEESNTKKLVKFWTHNIGECILDMTAITTDVFNVLILTERNLHNLNETGKFIFTKRLEYKPACMYAYVTPETKKLMVMVATDAYFLNIYENSTLKWSMRIDQIPVSVNRIFLTNLYGGVVLMSEDGFVQCVYLGTHPSVYLVPPLIQPEINIHETESELKRLQNEILENDVMDPLTSDLVSVSLMVDPNLQEDYDLKTCKVTVEVKTQTPLSKVQILYVVDFPLIAKNPSHVVSSLCDRNSVTSYIYPKETGIISNLAVKIVVSYVTNNGIPNVIEKNGTLPLGLAVTGASPMKEAKYKLTIITNKPVCPMNQIFGEFATEESSPNVLGLKFLNSEVSVTILAAKASQRYRLQSDYMEGITLILVFLIDRLRRYFSKVPDFNLSFSSGLPMQIYFEYIERYFNMLKKEKTLQDRLAKRTCQYRTIQKKVLINLKDVTPKPVSNLHKILRDTYHMVIGSISELQDLERDLSLLRCCISSLSRLLISLLEIMTISAKDLAQLKIVFSPKMHDTDEQGWIEVQGAAASFFLRTSLAKSVRDQQKPTDISLEPVTDISKFFKHLSAVIDRVTKGTHLLERNEFEGDKEPLSTMPIHHEWDEAGKDEIVPTGSKFTDLDILPTLDSLLIRKDKKLVKQERVDSITAIDMPAMINETQEEVKHPPNIVSIETVATIETPNVPDETSADQPTPQNDMLINDNKIEKKIQEEKIIKPFEGDVPDFIEDDAIWDLKMDEMRI